MNIISGNSIEEMVDYSFGDQAGVLMGIPGAFMNKANEENKHFLNWCLLSNLDKPLALFVDNIRLYKRPIVHNPVDKVWIDKLQEEDLLDLCSKMPNDFIIYTSHEDTPIDEYIKNRIPPNVLKIYATNAIYNDDKVIPFPYGLQRKMNFEDKRIEIMEDFIEMQTLEHNGNIKPEYLLYINCGLGSERNAPERAFLPHFEQYDWATCRFNKDSMHFPHKFYNFFLSELVNHKFVICPQGHGIDCHRNWETLYVRRVPVMKKSPYFSRLMQDFPVLFVDRWEDVTEELLAQNDHLYKQALEMDLTKLDLNKYEAR